MKYCLIVGLLVVNLLPLSAQELTASDIVEIQQKALRHVRRFEGLLNLIAQPDEYFRENNVDELIRSHYQPGSEYQIFRDSLAVIENDLNPNAQPDNDDSLSVRDYLTLFFSVYEKSPINSVFFNNYEVSSVKQGTHIYVEVFYTSEFINRHRDYPDQPYPVRQKKATVRAQRQDDGWQVEIVDINYRPREDASAGTMANAFTPLPRAYRPGKTYSLPLQINPDAPPSSLILYRNDQQVEDLSYVLADSSLTWRVPKQIDRGDDYQFHLYDSLTQKTIESSSFAIKRGFP